MNTRITKWGNGLAIRIPSSFAEEAGVGQGTLDDLTLDQGRLVVRSVREGGLVLDELQGRVTDDHLHGEADTGPPMGREFRA